MLPPNKKTEPLRARGANFHVLFVFGGATKEQRKISSLTQSPPMVLMVFAS